MLFPKTNKSLFGGIRAQCNMCSNEYLCSRETCDCQKIQCSTGRPVTRVSHRATKQGGFITTGLEDRERLFRCFRVHGGWVFPEEQPAAFLFVANASSCNISDKYRAFSCQDGLHVVKAISVSVNTGSRLSESISKASPASPGRCKMSSSTRRMGIWRTGPP